MNHITKMNDKVRLLRRNQPHGIACSAIRLFIDRIG